MNKLQQITKQPHYKKWTELNIERDVKLSTPFSFEMEARKITIFNSDRSIKIETMKT